MKTFKKTLSMFLALLMIIVSVPLASLQVGAAAEPYEKDNLQLRWFVNNVTADESNKGRNPVGTGSYSWTTNDTYDSASFNGGRAWYTVQSGNLLNNNICGGTEGGSGTTIAFMAKSDLLNDNPFFCIMNKDYESSGNYKTVFSVAPNGKVIYSNSEGGKHDTNQAFYGKSGIWRTYVIKFYSSKSLEIWIDGDKVFGEQSDYYDNHTFDIPNVIKVAANREDNAIFTGKIRDFRVYNKDLPAPDVHNNLLACAWKRNTVNVTPATIADFDTVKSQLNSFTAASAAVTGSFVGDGDYSNYSDHWKGLVYAERNIASYSSTGGVELGSDWSGSNSAYGNMYVPTAVAIYTRSNPIQIPVMTSVSVARSGSWNCYFKIWGVELNNSGLSFVNSKWNGKDEVEAWDNAYTNGNQTTNIPKLNFMWGINQTNYTLNTTKSQVDLSSSPAEIDPGYGKKSEVFSNKLTYSAGFGSATKVTSKKFNPAFNMYVSVRDNDSGSNAKAINFSSSSDSIYVIDYQTYLDKITSVKSFVNNNMKDVNRYTASSLAAYLTAVRKLISINPADTNVYNYAAGIEESINAAVEDMNTAMSEYDAAEAGLVPQYRIIFRNAAGTDINTSWLAEGATPDIPANTSVAEYNADMHKEYSWPQVNTVSKDMIYQEIEKNVNHTFETLSNVSPAACGVNRVDHVKCTVCGNIQDRTIPDTALTHNYVAVTTPSTCLEGGYTTYTCSYCNNTYTSNETIALNHSFTIKVKDKIEPTCSEYGYEAIFKCERCEETSGGEQIEKKAHTPKVIPAVSATCQNKGKTEGIECSVCGFVIKEQTGTPTVSCAYIAYVSDGNATCIEDGTKTSPCRYAYDGCENTKTIEDVGSKNNAAHVFGEEGTVSKDPTCISKGERTYTCTVCNIATDVRAEIEADPVNGHNFVLATDKVEPTCSVPGTEKLYKCEYCDATQGGATINPTGIHNYTVLKEEGKAATCKEDGKEELMKCATCNLTQGGNVIPKTSVAHTYKYVVTEPDCENPGYTTAVCEVCGDNYIVPGSEKEKNGHSYELIDDGFAATCKATGKNPTYKCSVCKNITGGEIIPINPENHNPVTMAAVKATCQATGLTEGKKCSICGTILVAQQETDLADHTPKTIPAVESTCTVAGLSEGSKCSVCGEILVAQQPTELKNHTPVSAENGIAATCKTEGKESDIICSACNTLITAGNTIQLAEHTPGQPVVENKIDSTCSVKGSYEEVVYCTVCNTQISRTEKEISLKEHTPVEIPEVPNSCTESGLTAGLKCSVCGSIIKAQQTIPAAHTIIDVAEVPASCESEGYTAGKKCSVCETVIEGIETIGALNHSYTKLISAEIPAGCTTDGKKAVMGCIRCDSQIGGEIITKNGHVLKDVAAKSATCSEDGWNAYVYCTVCDYTTKVIRPKTNNHIYSILAAKEVKATCEENGTTAVYKCKTCDLTTGGDVIESTGHNYIDHAAKEPTCLSTGYPAFRTCSKCSYSTFEIIPATGEHIYNVVVSEKINPTCIKTGREAVVRCATCTLTIGGEVIPTINHIDETNDGICDMCDEYIPCYHPETILVGKKDATCTQRGYTGDNVCVVCNEIVKKGQYVAPSGHQEEILPAVEPTCLTTGLSQGSWCPICEQTIRAQYVIARKNHIRVTVKGYEPTCTTPGMSDMVYCSECNTVFEEATVLPIASHVDYNRDDICDICGQRSSDRCTCYCHRADETLFTRIGYMFMRIFWIITGNNKTCRCGVTHY